MATHSTNTRKNWHYTWIGFTLIQGLLLAPIMLFFGEKLPIGVLGQSISDFFLQALTFQSIYLGALCFFNVVKDAIDIRDLLNRHQQGRLPLELTSKLMFDVTFRTAPIFIGTILFLITSFAPATATALTPAIAGLFIGTFAIQSIRWLFNTYQAMTKGEPISDNLVGLVMSLMNLALLTMIFGPLVGLFSAPPVLPLIMTILAVAINLLSLIHTCQLTHDNRLRTNTLIDYGVADEITLDDLAMLAPAPQAISKWRQCVRFLWPFYSPFVDAQIKTVKNTINLEKQTQTQTGKKGTDPKTIIKTVTALNCFKGIVTDGKQSDSSYLDQVYTAITGEQNTTDIDEKCQVIQAAADIFGLNKPNEESTTQATSTWPNLSQWWQEVKQWFWEIRHGKEHKEKRSLKNMINQAYKKYQRNNDQLTAEPNQANQWNQIYTKYKTKNESNDNTDVSVILKRISPKPGQEDELKATKDELKATQAKLKATQAKLKEKEDELRTTKDQLKAEAEQKPNGGQVVTNEVGTQTEQDSVVVWKNPTTTSTTC